MQKVALTNPCTLAEQCSNPIYFESIAFGGMRFGVGLTVNVGEE